MLISGPKQTAVSWRRQRFSAAPWLVLIVCILLLGGCSSTQWLYRNADWVIERYAVKSLDVNEAQLEAWRPLLERVLKQHLDREIPILEHYLDLMARAVAGLPGERVDAACLVSATNLIFTRHAQLAADLTAPLIVKLDLRQIDHLADYLAERRSHFRERYLKGDDMQRHQARVQRLTRRIEKWTGTLNSNQQARIQQFTSSLPDVAANWFGHREHREERLLQLLHDDADVKSLHAHLLNWWIPWDGADPKFTSQWRKAEAAFIHLLDDLSISLTDRQRQHLDVEIFSLQREIARLGGDKLHAKKERTKMLHCDRQQI